MAAGAIHPAEQTAAAAHLRSDIANRTAAGLGATFNRSETVYATVRAWSARARRSSRAGRPCGTPRGRTTCHSATRRRTCSGIAPTRATRAACAAATTRPRMRAARRRLCSGRGGRSGRLRFVRREPSEHRPVRRVLRGQRDVRRVRRRAERVGVMDGCDGSQDSVFKFHGPTRGGGAPGAAIPTSFARRATRARAGAAGATACQLGRDPGRVRRVPGVGRPDHGQGGELHVFRVRRGSRFRRQRSTGAATATARRTPRRRATRTPRCSGRSRTHRSTRTRITTPITSTT